MQLNTLNRVIALFLIGGFVVVLAAVMFEPQILTLPATGALLAVALLSITALAGVIVDALSSLTVRRWIRMWIAQRRSRARVFLCGSEFDEQDRWRKAFHATLESDPRYRNVAHEDMIKAASAGMFFRTADKEHSEWLVQQYSMYYLAANFVIVLIAWAIWAFWSGAFWQGVAAFAGAYLLMTFAVDNYLYTYQWAFRNAYLALNDVTSATPAANIQETHHYVYAMWRPYWMGAVHLPSCGRVRRARAR